MSKHVPRKARWTQVSPKEYRAVFGVVRYHARAWEGTVFYELREQNAPDGAIVRWRPEMMTVGRYKRPRNAMMAVEERAREVRRRYQDQVRIVFDE